MKKTIKINTLLLICLFTFFIGINEVKGLECEYYAPYSGMTADGSYIIPNHDKACYKDKGLHKCSFKARLNSNYISNNHCNGKFILDIGAYMEADWNDIFATAGFDLGEASGDSYANKPGAVTMDIKMLGTDGSKMDTNTVSSKVKTVIKSNEKCPKFIIVNRKDNQARKTRVFYRGTPFFKDLFSAYGVNAPCRAGDDVNSLTPISAWNSGIYYNDDYYMLYQGTSSTSDYKKYLKSSKYITKNKKGSIDSLFGDYYILPYYTKRYQSGDKTIEQVEDAKNGARAYVEIFDGPWYKTMSDFQGKLEKDCGSDWYKYINRMNYGLKSSALFTYAEGDYKKDNLKDNDKGMEKTCWNTRKEFFKAFESMQLYMYGMGANTITEFEQISNFQANTVDEYTEKLKKVSVTEEDKQNLYYRVYLEDDTRVQHFKYLLYFFEGVKVGTNFTPEAFKSSKNELVNKKDESQYKIKVLRSDQCSYLCSSVEIEKSYNECKKNNSEYKKCLDALDKCNSRVCSECLPKNYGNEFDNCMKGCPAVTSSCMESNGIKDFETKSKEALNSSIQSKENLDKASEYTFEPVNDSELPEIKLSIKKYEPNCSDVKVFTIIWNILSLSVPFLIMIFGSLDYFKAVIAGNEEGIKKAKSAFPKRLIAFVIFFIMPFFVKVLLTNAGARGSGNVTYIRCILTRNTGDDESDNNSKSKDTKDSNNKEKKESTKGA